MSALPRVQTENREVNQLQQNVISALTPILTNPIISYNVLSEVSLVVGSNSINHGLNRKLQGWFLVRKRADASIYDTQDANDTPAQTLELVSDAPVVVNLYVF